MDVVLRQDVDHVGLRGEVVNVARGYARNYLLPRGLAEVATPALQKEIAKRDAIRARQEAKTVDEGNSIAERLNATVIRFDVTAGPTGTLFGSVTATNVADRLWADQKIRIDRRKLQMDTIKHVGRYTVTVDVFGDVTAELRLVVAPEGVELPTEEELAAAAAAEAEAEAAAAAPAAPAAPAEAAPAQPEPVEADVEPPAPQPAAAQPAAPQPPAAQPAGPEPAGPEPTLAEVEPRPAEVEPQPAEVEPQPADVELPAAETAREAPVAAEPEALPADEPAEPLATDEPSEQPAPPVDEPEPQA